MMKFKYKFELYLSLFFISGTVYSGADVVKENLNPNIKNVEKKSDYSPENQELIKLLKQTRIDGPEGQAAALKIDSLFSNDAGKRKYSFSDPQVLNIVFYDFGCSNSNMTVFSLLAPELVEELESNPDKIMKSVFLVQAGRLSESEAIFKKIIHCFSKKPPSTYNQLTGVLNDVWGEVPISSSQGELADKRLALLKEMNKIVQTQNESLDKIEFQTVDGKKFYLNKKQVEKFRNILIDFEKDLNNFIPIQPREASLRSNSAGASNAKTGHVK